jgi:hypothetical protein
MQVIEEREVNLKDVECQSCEVWSRVMGYFRPFSEYNHGKTAEFCSCVCFKEQSLKKNRRKIKGRGLDNPASSYYLKIIMMILSTIIKMLKPLTKFIILSFQPLAGGWEKSKPRITIDKQ